MLKNKIKKTAPKKTAPKKMSSHIEIERRFLLKRFPKKVIEKFKDKIEVLHIIQYYYNIDGVINRFREVKRDGKKTKYIHEIKKSIRVGENEEMCGGITEKVFLKKKEEHKNDHSYVRKTRYVIKHKGLKFEIDVYVDVAIITLEVELPSLSHHFEWPEGLFEEIIMEITGIKQLSNLSLSVKVKK